MAGEAFTYLSSGVLNVDRLDVEYAGGGGTVWTRPRRDQDCWNVALDVARRSLDRSRRQDDDVMLCLDQGRARLLTHHSGFAIAIGSERRRADIGEKVLRSFL